MKLTKGAIVLVEMMGIDEYQMQGSRPCVVISNNVGNKVSPVVIVSPLTSKDKKPMPTHTDIYPSERNGLNKKSTLLAEQIATISKSNIIKVLGELDNLELKRVNSAIQKSLEL